MNMVVTEDESYFSFRLFHNATVPWWRSARFVWKKDTPEPQRVEISLAFDHLPLLCLPHGRPGRGCRCCPISLRFEERRWQMLYDSGKVTMRARSMVEFGRPT